MAREPMILRQYQIDALERVRAELRNGHKRVLFVAPTGSGKTVCAADIIRSAVAKNSRVLFLAHREELINQTSDKLDRIGVDHGVIQGNHPRHRPHCLVQVVSVPTMARRIAKPALMPKDVRIIIVDECQHARSESYANIMEFYPEAVVIGLTATPWRLDGKGLGEMFTALVQAAKVHELIAGGSLVSFEGFAYDRPDLDGVKKRAGDYDLKLLDGAMKQTILGGSIIRDYLEHAKGTRALAFAVNVEHSLAIVEQARAAGITAEHVDADTPSSIRAALLGRGGKFETGEVMFVSNCMIMSEGTDVPSIQTLLLMRPTASLVLALQMIGRGLRPWCFTCRDAPRPTCVGHDVKRVCRIHDHANVLETHGLPDEDRPMSLDMDAPPKPAPVSTCRKCNAMFPSGHTTCPRCGAPIETVTGMSGREITEDGDARRLTIEEIRARRKEGLDELTDAELMRVHKATREEKAAEYLRLIRVRDERGLKEKFPDAAYRAVFGVWPKFDDEFLAGITPATRSFIPYKRRS